MNFQYCTIVYHTGLRDDVNSLTLKGCHGPLTAFCRPVKAVLISVLLLIYEYFSVANFERSQFAGHAGRFSLIKYKCQANA